MARYKIVDRSPRFLPIVLDAQLLSGSFEYALDYLIDHEIELPAGVVRVAPIEDTVEGVIAFPPSQWDGRPVEGLKLHFSHGRVVAVTAASKTGAEGPTLRRRISAGSRISRPISPCGTGPRLRGV